MPIPYAIAVVLVLILTGCLQSVEQGSTLVNPIVDVLTSPRTPSDLPLDQIILPEGYAIEIYASPVPNARSLTLSPEGMVFVGSRSAGNVYALLDRDADYHAEEVKVVATGLHQPNGVAFRGRDLYVAEISRILKWEDIEQHLEDLGEPTIVYDAFPSESHHGWKFIAFGPDEKLYVPVGAPCNICDPRVPFASLTRMNADGSSFEMVARGIRNTVGFTWHPETGELWFTDNGRDWLGDDIPPDELNRITREGQHFGYPYYHGKSVKDPDFSSPEASSEFTSATVELGPHVAALGLRFNSGKMFTEYERDIFIAEHGSWNRTVPIGYRITTVNPDTLEYTVFAEGWLQNGIAWGRPVDVQELEDGSLLVSDDKAGVVYRIYKEGQDGKARK